MEREVVCLDGRISKEFSTENDITIDSFIYSDIELESFFEGTVKLFVVLDGDLQVTKEENGCQN